MRENVIHKIRGWLGFGLWALVCKPWWTRTYLEAVIKTMSAQMIGVMVDIT
jgi:hypothetical protein